MKVLKKMLSMQKSLLLKGMVLSGRKRSINAGFAIINGQIKEAGKYPQAPQVSITKFF